MGIKKDEIGFAGVGEVEVDLEAVKETERTDEKEKKVGIDHEGVNVGEIDLTANNDKVTSKLRMENDIFWKGNRRSVNELSSEVANNYEMQCYRKQRKSENYEMLNSRRQDFIMNIRVCIQRDAHVHVLKDYILGTVGISQIE